MRIINPSNRIVISNLNSIAQGQLFQYDCDYRYLTTDIYPWTTTQNGVSSFSDILFKLLNEYLNGVGLDLNECVTNTLKTYWNVNLSLNNQVISSVPFFTGTGISQFPNNNQWMIGLTTALNSIINNGLSYYYDSNRVVVYSLICNNEPNFENFQINTGINFNIECN
jgi:hypothetical protein